MLIEYCVSVGKTNYAYIKAVGKDWGLREVDTVEKAAEQIESLNSINRIWKALATNAGMSNTRPTTKHIPYIKRWTSEFKFNEEMIIYAYEETINCIGKFRISYTDSILKTWFESGFKNPDDVERGRTLFAEKFTAKKTGKISPQKEADRTASYDLDEFEERSLHGTLKYKRKNKE
jgi:DnaD/phage-associated family protein